MSKIQLNRRQFLAASATLSSGLVLGMSISSQAKGNSHLQPNAWLQITAADEVIFQLDKTEMGQGVYTSLTTIIAEELEIDPRKIKVELAHIHHEFQDPIQITGGSNSINSRWQILRETGATARQMLITAAAKSWQVEVQECYADDGKIIHRPSKRSVSFGNVANSAAQFKTPRKPSLKTADQFKYIGKSLRRFDGHDKSTGQAKFGIDVQLEGLVNAVVVRNPHFNQSAGQYDASAAKQAKGVIDIFNISTGIAVVADSYWHARQAAEQLDITWDKGKLAGQSSDTIRAQWQEKAKQKGKSISDEGKGFKGLKTAAQVLEVVYEVPYLAHATMEPQNTTAQFHADGSCELWSPNQTPDLTQALVAEALGIKRKKITVHSTLMGGGFGRRGIPDFAVDAAEISRAVNKPVKVLWSREDDMQHDYYRPATYNVLKAGLDENGLVETWHHKFVAPSLAKSLLPVFAPIAPQWMPDWMVNALVSGSGALLKNRDPTTTEGAVELPYEIDNIDIRHVFHDPGIPLGFWRSVGHSQNAFITESFIDELAFAAKQDPYQFRRQLLSKQPKHLAVLDLAAQKANWGNTDNTQGIAVHESFGTVVAEVVTLNTVNGKNSISEVTCAVDCGLAVNPDLVSAQIESGVVFGLTAALKGRITIKDGAVEQSNFHDYEMLRMHETPKISVHIIPSDSMPTGVGEPGTPPIAPAVANALFAATGVRQRSLPLNLG